jgi:hypothetical protein
MCNPIRKNVVQYSNDLNLMAVNYDLIEINITKFNIDNTCTTELSDKNEKILSFYIFSPLR